MLDRENLIINLKVQLKEWEKEIKKLQLNIKKSSEKDKAKLQKKIERIKTYIKDGKEKLKKLAGKNNS
jgi:septal ring factor EnvC (AmiA/AmiB activator)